MDQRKHARISIRAASVFCRRPWEKPGPDGRNLAAHLVDVCLGGACILSPEALPAGARLEFEVHFSQYQGGLKAPAVVKWSRGADHSGRRLYLTGLAFSRAPELTGRGLDSVLGQKPSGVATRILHGRANRRKSSRVHPGASKIVCVPAGLLAGLGLARNTAKSLVDLSQRGARFSSRALMAPGQRVMLKVRIPSLGDLIEVAGRVRWCRTEPGSKPPHHVGVEFENVSAKSRTLLEGLDRWLRRPAR